MKKIRGQQGFSLTEVMISMGLGVCALFLVGTLIFQTAKQRADVEDQSAVQQTYFLSLYSTRSTVKMKSLISAQTSMATASACLAGKGTNCTSLTSAGAQPLAGGDPELSDAYFSRDSRCAAFSPTCHIKRTTTFQWICKTNTSCSGVRINVNVQEVDASGNLSGILRQGSFVVDGRALAEKGTIEYGCESQGRVVSGIDFETQSAICANFEATVSCSMPMKNYANGTTSADCASLQDQSCGISGFTKVGFYGSQSECASGSLGAAAEGLEGEIKTSSSSTSPKYADGTDIYESFEGVVNCENFPWLCSRASPRSTAGTSTTTTPSVGDGGDGSGDGGDGGGDGGDGGGDGGDGGDGGE